jgi:hypothetical protein
MGGGNNIFGVNVGRLRPFVVGVSGITVAGRAEENKGNFGGAVTAFEGAGVVTEANGFSVGANMGGGFLAGDSPSVRRTLGVKIGIVRDL